ncbi:hypothetical protein F511_27581 [Dorcoceras hygrometricum]|uniref:Uncharacterized protein n=1 Tax=Dorcoceras hygrometricum TaxID=472368 RepID=A0A2Z7CSZ9_9LAMI|nr:hypothetical protein F511_27581 [Dorcoceras hygrometricum]
MHAAIPGSTLRGNPHINSKVHFRKKTYSNTSHGEDDSIYETHTPSSKSKVATTSKKRKRKQVNEVDEAIVATINNLADITKVTMNDLVKQLAGTNNLADAQDVVFDALRGMSELSEDEQVIAAQLLFNNHNNMALFKCLNDKGKLSLVRRLLRDCGSLRQSGPPDPRLLRQAALEALTRSARTDSPRRVGRKLIFGDNGRRRRRRRTAGGGGGAWRGEEGRLSLGLGFKL